MLEIARNIKNTIRCRRRNKDAWLELKLMEILLLLQDDWNAPTTTGSTYLYSPAKIAKALSLVFENNRFVSTQEAARSCSMNRNAFGRKFKEIMGIPFSEFGLRYRISEAAKQLRNTDLPTKAIAAEWGFTDASHLYRCFLKYYGYSPTEYRRLNIHEKGFPRSLTCKRGFAPVILPSSRRG
ncbi:MAG: helix-turn-helix transcriptional regulator [Phycisphaerae bacterium]|nr:helix-turn-helix transcriptional regulator [Phycisphaerae bacterium]